MMTLAVVLGLLTKIGGVAYVVEKVVKCIVASLGDGGGLVQ